MNASLRHIFSQSFIYRPIDSSVCFKINKLKDHQYVHVGYRMIAHQPTIASEQVELPLDGVCQHERYLLIRFNKSIL